MKLFAHVSLLSLLAVALSVNAAAQGAGSLKGQVRGDDTQTGLAGANVYIPSLSKGAVTDGNGNYRISDIPNGTYTVEFSFIGYTKRSARIAVDGATTYNTFLDPTVVEMGTVTYEVNRAEIRKTPIAFSNITGEEINERYTTQDVPDLLKLVPGVYTTNLGLGEAGIYVRGFDTEHAQIMINGVPVNDPESQFVYWSNWTGLSGNTQSVQVQRGVGS